MAPCTHPGMKRLFCLQAKKSSVASLPRPCPITSREVNEARRPHTCSRPCAFEQKKNEKKRKKDEKIRPTQKTSRSPQQPGDRDHLETARDETRPTRQPILVRFHRSRVCGNRPRKALAISENDECFTYTDTQTDGQTYRLNDGALYAPRYEEAFLPKCKKRPRELPCLIINELQNKHAQRTCLMYHAAYKVEFQPFNRSYSLLTFFNFLYNYKVPLRDVCEVKSEGVTQVDEKGHEGNTSVVTP